MFETRCTCLSRDLTPEMIESYIAQPDGTLWAQFPICPSHGCRAIEVVYSPVLGRIHDTALAVEASAVQRRTETKP